MLVAAVVATTSLLGVGRDVLTAALRAAAQRAGVSAVIVAVVRSLSLSAAFVVLMLVIASVTSARRMTGGRGELLAVVPIAIGAALVLTVVLATRARSGVVQMLTPPLDQTRTVGRVRFPGGSPGCTDRQRGSCAGGRAPQLLVLVGLRAAETVVVVITVELVAGRLIRCG